MYKFMAIWGNCLPLFILGDTIVKGPVDNIITKNVKCLELLLNDKYLDFIKHTKFTESERPVSFEGDSPIAYDNENVRIVHNNPLTEKYIKRTQERCENLKKFIKKVREDENCYFLYSLNNFDVNRKLHTFRGNTFVNNVEYLKKLKLLDKVIFVGTYGKIWTDFHTKEILPLIKKYKLKYVEVKGVKSWIDSSKEDLAELHDQFIKGVKKVTAKKQVNTKKETVYDIWREMENKWKI